MFGPNLGPYNVNKQEKSFGQPATQSSGRLDSQALFESADVKYFATEILRSRTFDCVNL